MRNSPAWKGIVAFLGACVALSLPSGCGKDAPTSAPEQPAKDPGRDDKTDPLADAKAHSKSNLKAIATAVGKFENQNYFLPVGLVDPKTARMGLSWRVQILPYLDDAKAPDLYKQFRLNEPWDSEHNGKLLASMPKVFAPVRGKAPEGHTYYQGFARHAVGVKLGQNAKPLASNEPFQDTFDTRGIFPDPRALFQVNGVPESGLPVKGPRLTGITDGTANTILAVEAGETVPWTKPQDVAFAVNLGDFLELKPKHDPKLGGLFDGDFHIVMVSGDVHYVKRGAPRDKLWPFIGPSNGTVRDYVGLGLEEPEWMKDPKPALDGAKVALTRERIRQIDIALAQHKVQNGVYPADLTALTEGKNPLKAESLIDPWGLLCQYDPTGPKNKGAKPDVWTVAPDKTVIGNWKEAKE